MTWRQGQSRTNDTQSVTEITKLRLENTKLKIDIQNCKREVQPLGQQNNRLSAQLAQQKNKQDKSKLQLIKISAVLGCNQVSRLNTTEEILENIQKKILQSKQKISLLQKQLKNANQNDNSVGHKIMQKQKQIQLYLQRIQQKQQQNKNLSIKNNLLVAEIDRIKLDSQRKDALLGELSHRVSQLQIERKDIQEQISDMRTNNHDFQAKKVKKECQQLLSQVNVKDDDYLRSYLMKNYRYQNGNNSVSRKNKYDFIFQN